MAELINTFLSERDWEKQVLCLVLHIDTTCTVAVLNMTSCDVFVYTLLDGEADHGHAPSLLSVQNGQQALQTTGKVKTVLSDGLVK